MSDSVFLILAFAIMMINVVIVTIFVALFIVLMIKLKKQKNSVNDNRPQREPRPMVQNDHVAINNPPVQNNPPSDNGPSTVNMFESKTIHMFEHKNYRLVLEQKDNSNIKYAAFFATTMNDAIPVGQITIGRENGDIIINDSAVSSSHCTVLKSGGDYYLEDNGSSNHTYYNGMEVSSKQRIFSGGILKIGRHEYMIRIEEG